MARIDAETVLAGSAPGNIADNDNLGIVSYRPENQKVHPAAQQSVASPLESRQNQQAPAREPALPAREPPPHVVVDFENEALATVPSIGRSPRVSREIRTESPDRRRRRNNPPSRFQTDDKENL